MFDGVTFLPNSLDAQMLASLTVILFCIFAAPHIAQADFNLR